MPQTITDADRVTSQRTTLPTASFSLRVVDIAWLESEHKRRGISKSELVRDLIEAARTAQEAEAA